MCSSPKTIKSQNQKVRQRTQKTKEREKYPTLDDPGQAKRTEKDSENM